MEYSSCRRKKLSDNDDNDEDDDNDVAYFVEDADFITRWQNRVVFNEGLTMRNDSDEIHVVKHNKRNINNLCRIWNFVLL